MTDTLVDEMRAPATETPPAEAPATKPKRSKSAPASATEARTLVRVTYTAATEFVDEMAADADLIEHRIVRVIVREDPPAEGYGMSRVDLIAGYVARGQVFELVANVGTDWHTNSETDELTRTRRDELRADIERAAHDLGLDVRGGRFGSL